MSDTTISDVIAIDVDPASMEIVDEVEAADNETGNTSITRSRHCKSVKVTQLYGYYTSIFVYIGRRCAVFTAEAAAADPCAGRPMCMLACAHGFVHDDEGCDRCECAAGASLCT